MRFVAPADLGAKFGGKIGTAANHLIPRSPESTRVGMASDDLYRPLEAFKPLFWLLRFLSDDHQGAWCMESISMLSLIGRIPLIGVLRAGSGY